MRDLEGKTAVITGSASGMGLAFAECFGREGMNVVMADIEETALKAAAARVEAVGGTSLPVVTDVGNAAAMERLGEAARDAFGAAHLVCLNAGIAPPDGPMEELTLNDWKWTFDVNLWGVVHGIRVFVPGLKRQDEGHVVITASVAGLTSYPWLAPYNATKHAVVSLAETLFAELREAGSQVGVSALCPGAVVTNIGAAERNRPKELANDAPPKRQPGDLGEFAETYAGFARAPADVAERVLAAVLEGRFWIETDDVFRRPIAERHRAIEERKAPPARGQILDPYLER